MTYYEYDDGFNGVERIPVTGQDIEFLHDFLIRLQGALSSMMEEDEDIRRLREESDAALAWERANQADDWKY